MRVIHKICTDHLDNDARALKYSFCTGQKKTEVAQVQDAVN